MGKIILSYLIQIIKASGADQDVDSNSFTEELLKYEKRFLIFEERFKQDGKGNS